MSSNGDYKAALKKFLEQIKWLSKNVKDKEEMYNRIKKGRVDFKSDSLDSYVEGDNYGK